jgi:hypothetical protein
MPVPTLLDAIAAAVDPGGAVPLYHQIAAIVRTEIAAGRLPIGGALPTLRAVEQAAGVNYHTVRQAWDELVADQVLSVRRGRGGVVLRAPRADDRWLVTPATPATGSGAGSLRPVVWVAVTRIDVAAELAGELMAGWRVIAAPWPLDAPAPPPGAILTDAAVHQPEWLARAADTAALPLTPPRNALALITSRARDLGHRRVRLVADPGDAARDDLARQLPRIGLALADDLEPSGTPTITVTLPSGRHLIDHPPRHDAHRLDLPATWAAGPLAGVAHQWSWASHS